MGLRQALYGEGRTSRRLSRVLGALHPEPSTVAGRKPEEVQARAVAASKKKPLFLIAQMSHETNTYSPVPTDLARFAGGLPGSGAVPLAGPAVAESFGGTRSGVGAFLELAEEAGADVVTPISASAPPSGTVHDHAFEYICDAICDSVAADKPDAILLCLHGAMAVESHEDGEGELLQRIRQLAPDTPIAITLDMHCNFYDEIAACADTVAGYHTCKCTAPFCTPMAGRSSAPRRLQPRPFAARLPPPVLKKLLAQTRTRTCMRRRCEPAGRCSR